jgi:hypothetical protein
MVSTRSGLRPDCENATASCPATRSALSCSVTVDIGSEATGTPSRRVTSVAK